jgi:outer membrane autotransporter protein
MTKLMKIVGLTLVLAASASVQAQQKGQGSGLYGELAISPIKLDLDDGAQSKSAYDVNGMRVVLGQKIHPNLSVEGMLGTGLGDDSKTVVIDKISVKSTVKVRNFMGAYLRAHTHLTPEIEVFGRAGFARMTLRATAVAGNMSEKTESTDNSFSYGLGMNYNLNKTTYVGLDLTRYNTEGKSKVQGVSLTAGYRF